MSEGRINEILQRLNEQHFDGATVEPNDREWLQQQIDAENNKEGNLHEQDGYNCDICKNKGFMSRLHEAGYEVTYPCKCQTIRDTLRRARRSGLGNILTDYKFDKYEVTEEWQKTIKDKAQAFCKDTGAQWFYIGGQTGAGKTHICTAIAAHYIKAGLNCRYMLWRDDAVKLKSVVNDFALYQKHIEPLKKVDVLYIDDFLKTKDETDPTAADINVAFELINHRLLDKDKITIISSEFTISKALEFDEATFGRVYQLTGEYKINIDRDIKKNYRLK